MNKAPQPDFQAITPRTAIEYQADWMKLAQTMPKSAETAAIQDAAGTHELLARFAIARVMGDEATVEAVQRTAVNSSYEEAAKTNEDVNTVIKRNSSVFGLLERNLADKPKKALQYIESLEFKADEERKAKGMQPFTAESEYGIFNSARSSKKLEKGAQKIRVENKVRLGRQVEAAREVEGNEALLDWFTNNPNKAHKAWVKIEGALKGIGTEGDERNNSSLFDLADVKANKTLDQRTFRKTFPGGPDGLVSILLETGAFDDESGRFADGVTYEHLLSEPNLFSMMHLLTRPEAKKGSVVKRVTGHVSAAVYKKSLKGGPSIYEKRANVIDDALKAVHAMAAKGEEFSGISTEEEFSEKLQIGDSGIFKPNIIYDMLQLTGDISSLGKPIDRDGVTITANESRLRKLRNNLNEYQANPNRLGYLELGDVISHATERFDDILANSQLISRESLLLPDVTMTKKGVLKYVKETPEESMIRYNDDQSALAAMLCNGEISFDAFEPAMIEEMLLNYPSLKDVAAESANLRDDEKALAVKMGMIAAEPTIDPADPSIHPSVLPLQPTNRQYAAVSPYDVNRTVNSTRVNQNTVNEAVTERVRINVYGDIAQMMAVKRGISSAEINTFMGWGNGQLANAVLDSFVALGYAKRLTGSSVEISEKYGPDAYSQIETGLRQAFNMNQRH